MGQRLNIEIKENEKVLANAYYHWSGYTSSSLEIVQTILKSIKNIKYENKVVSAIKLLESTGSGLTDEEISFGKKNIENFDSYNFKKTTGRNDGLTAISEEGIKTTERWEEARVEIDLVTKTINFKAIWEFTKEEFIEAYERYDNGKYDEVPMYNINFHNIDFDKFKELADLILNLIKENIYKIKLKDDEKVYGFIE